jgi:predicted acetyltransferase
MDYSIRLAQIGEKKIIFALLQSYLQELSHFPGEHLDYKDENGIYLYPYLDAYWQEKERYPYLLYDNEKTAGFALVRKDGDHWEMAEFYVKPLFRRRGLAAACSADICLRHTGMWKISFNKQNPPGWSLWQKLAKRLSNGAVEQGEIDSSHDYIRFSI